LTTVELRKAFAVGRGDPILLGMVSAAHRRDTASLQHLGARITCPRD
jgi:hypothetical protein